VAERDELGARRDRDGAGFERLERRTATTTAGELEKWDGTEVVTRSENGHGNTPRRGDDLTVEHHDELATDLTLATQVGSWSRRDNREERAGPAQLGARQVGEEREVTADEGR
jgi:hypothetical protein